MDFSRVAKPIYELLIKKCTIKGRERVPRCPLKHQWNGPVSTRKTLNLLIDKLVNPPVLAYPDFNLSFVLHTDASERGLGAILYQQQDGGLRVIAYSSRNLSPAIKNYRLHIPDSWNFLH